MLVRTRAKQAPQIASDSLLLVQRTKHAMPQTAQHTQKRYIDLDHPALTPAMSLVKLLLPALPANSYCKTFRPSSSLILEPVLTSPYSRLKQTIYQSNVMVSRIWVLGYQRPGLIDEHTLSCQNRSQIASTWTPDRGTSMHTAGALASGLSTIELQRPYHLWCHHQIPRSGSACQPLCDCCTLGWGVGWGLPSKFAQSDGPMRYPGILLGHPDADAGMLAKASFGGSSWIAESERATIQMVCLQLSKRWRISRQGIFEIAGHPKDLLIALAVCNRFQGCMIFKPLLLDDLGLQQI